MNPPRLLHLFNRYRFFGGEEAAVNRMTSVMRQSGVEVRECFASSEDWEGPQAPARWRQALLSLNNSDFVERVQSEDATLHSDLWLGHNLFPIISAGVLRKAAQLSRPVFLYLHNYRPFSVNGAFWAGNQLRPEGLNGNFWPEIRAGSWQESRLRTAWMALVLKTALLRGWYDHVTEWIAVSQFVRDRFVQAGVPSQKISVLSYPFEPHSTSPGPANSNRFLFLSRLTEAKGTRVVLDAWRQLVDRLGASAPILAVAGEGEGMVWVQNAKSALGEKIEILGQIRGEQKDAALRDCQALIVPSIWWDPYPTVVYEAFDSARPVFAARSGGLPESVKSGVTGWLHKPGDSEELANQIEDASTQPATTQKMGQNARDWLLQHAGNHVWWEGFSKIIGKHLDCSKSTKAS
ncbi:MAG: glycosyltransferase family 4 protein [Verrucomicrobiales bacterium]|nr:glycosyltransferase family 4 protein [Verrucomicrobiales bacterium]